MLRAENVTQMQFNHHQKSDPNYTASPTFCKAHLLKKQKQNLPEYFQYILNPADNEL